MWSQSTHSNHLNMASPAVFVTGGNGGIGAAICKLLVLDRGCKVFMGSRSAEKGQNAVKEMGLGDKEGDITVVQCDVNVSTSIACWSKIIYIPQICSLMSLSRMLQQL